MKWPYSFWLAITFAFPQISDDPDKVNKAKESRDPVEIIWSKLDAEVLALGKAIAYQNELTLLSKNKSQRGLNLWQKRNPFETYAGWDFPNVDLSKARIGDFGKIKTRGTLFTLRRVENAERI